MALEFRDLLQEAGIDPRSVKMLRHYNSDGRSTQDAWRYAPDVFWRWVGFQKKRTASWFRRPIWANFVALDDGDTLFAGLTAAEIEGDAPPGSRDELRRRPMPDGMHHIYKLTHLAALKPEIGHLFVDWHPGRNWTRRAENHSYPVR
jgi:hypothetical protein